MTHDQWIDEANQIAQTFRDTHGGDEPVPHQLAHVLYRRAFEQDRFPTLEHAWAEWTGITPGPAPGPAPGPTPGPPPTPPPNLVAWPLPRFMASYFDALIDPNLDLRLFASLLQDADCTGTQVWLTSPWGVQQGGTGQCAGFAPFVRDRDGRWDVWAVDPRYLDRLRLFVEVMNGYGIVPILCGLELYSWASSKQGMLWVPDASRLWFRHNRQGLSYGTGPLGFDAESGEEFKTPDDEALIRTLASVQGEHAFLGAFYAAAVHTLSGLVYAVRTGNEMPEKGLHYRLRDRWREAGFTGPIITNRNQDTPGQYPNMQVGRAFEAIEFHGRRALDYLDQPFPAEPDYQTFRQFFDAPACEPSRVILSTDGCRNGQLVPYPAYDYEPLGEVLRDASRRGMHWDHQSGMKMGRFLYPDGRVQLDDFRREIAWLLAAR